MRRHGAGFGLPRIGEEVGAGNYLVLAVHGMPGTVAASHHDAVFAAHAGVGAGLDHPHAARAMPGGQRRLVCERIEHLLARRADEAGHFQMKASGFGHDSFPWSLVA